MKTITIVGGGMSGLALGIALSRRGIPVDLHEAGTYPRHRVCGEFISGIGSDTLDQLGISDILEPARRLETTSWHVNGRKIMSRELPESALGISRFALDRELANRFMSVGGNLLTRSRYRKAEKEAGVVWASGRASARESPWLGLKIHARQFEQCSDLEMHLGPDGYTGLASVEDGAVNVCGLFKCDPALKSKGPDLLMAYLARSGLDSLAARLGSAALDESSFLGVGAFLLGQQSSPGDRCTIGDAASMIPPFTGNGMTMALQSAAIAVGPLEEYARGKTGWSEAVDQIRTRLRSQFRRRLAVSRMLHPFLFSGGGRQLLAFAGGRGLLPFDQLYRLLR